MTNPPPLPSTGDVWMEILTGPGMWLPDDLYAAMDNYFHPREEIATHLRTGVLYRGCKEQR